MFAAGTIESDAESSVLELAARRPNGPGAGVISPAFPLIPIGENDRFIGVVTDRDIICKGLANDSFEPRRAVARVMTPGIHCCREDDDLAKAVHLLPEWAKSVSAHHH